MKRSLIVAASLVVATMASMSAPRHAGAQSTTSLGIAAGASAPLGDYGSTHDVGYHVMLTLDARPPVLPIGFRIDGMYNEIKQTNGTRTDIWAGTANVVVAAGLIPLVTPYAIGGVGLYSAGYPGINTGARTGPGVNAGAGVRFGLSGFSAFAEARYHRMLRDVNGQTVQFAPITFGLMFQ